MANSTITLEKREAIKHKNRAIRREGIVPAVVYGPNRESTNVQVAIQAAMDLIKSTTGSSVIKATLGDHTMNVFLAEIQTNPRTNQLTHVSFFEPDPNKKIIVHIPLDPIGISPAVKNNLGILFLPIDSVPVRGLPKDMVEHLHVDVTGLEKIGDSIKLADIKLPGGLELAHAEEEGSKTAVTITPFQKEIVEEVVTTAVEGEEGVEGEAAAEGEAKEGETATEGETDAEEAK